MSLFEITETDRAFYEDRLRDFLPARVVDIHTHCWLDKFRVAATVQPRRAVSWPALVANENPIESLVETFQLLLPGKDCSALVFGYPDREFDVDASNDYVAANVAKHGYEALMLSRPEWSAEEYAGRLDAGRFLGAKVYLNFAPEYIPGHELRILDFAPHHQLEVLDDRGAILILHIPRSARLKDPVNLHELIEIERRYPRLQIIVAHVGRAYCDGDLGDGFERLSESPRLMFDISANTNSHVFATALRAVGSERILFGSDLPITRMRMRRICEDGSYVNVVPPDLYGDISGDPNMRECPKEDAGSLTFFFYEEIDAFRQAAQECGLSATQVEHVFHRNADRCLAGAREYYDAAKP